VINEYGVAMKLAERPMQTMIFYLVLRIMYGPNAWPPVVVRSTAGKMLNLDSLDWSVLSRRS